MLVPHLVGPSPLFLPLLFLVHLSSSAKTADSQVCDYRPFSQLVQSLHTPTRTADCGLGDSCIYPPHHNPRNGDEFDFIVVGAGSAGSVVASRLSEVTAWNVLLLEAGGDPTELSEIPAFTAALQKTEMDWQYKTEPDGRTCLGMKESRCNWPKGKGLGGSSTINFMFYVRGNAKDFDGWAAEGNTDWAYEKVLPYFKKFEDMRAEEVSAMPDFGKYHSTGGYLKVDSFNREGVEELGNILAEGMKEMGYHLNHDCNGKNQTGFAPVQGTLADGRRCSTAKAFLTPAKHRNNLKVSKDSLVTKILIREGVAYGVEFINSQNDTVTVLSKKEVIISAGSISSPQILMLSGIGPKKHLDDLNITLVADLPVGRNLQDHPLMPGIMLTFNYSKPFESPERSMHNFLMHGKGRYAGINMVSYSGFINTVKGIDYPDIAIMMVDFSKDEKSKLLSFLENYALTDDIKSKYVDVLSSHNIILLLSLLRPFSRGKIELKSTDPLEYPKIQPGFFTDQRDVETYLRTYDFVSQLVKTKGLKQGDAKLYEIQPPGCSGLKAGSPQYRECCIRHLAVTTYHHTSTCKMGPVSSPETAVDPHLRVKGVGRLRVIDASVMPSVVSGNTNAAVIMIGEKGSDLIKEDWLKDNRKN